MDCRERVQTAVRHCEPDRIPLDIGATYSSGIMAVAYAELREYLGLPKGRIRVHDFGQQLAEIEPDVLERFGVDAIDVFNSHILEDDRKWVSWTLPNGVQAERPAELRVVRSGSAGYIMKDSAGKTTARMPEGCLYFESVQPPLGEPPKNLAAYELPRLHDDYLERLETRAQWLHKNTDFAVVATFGGNILEMGQALRGWGNFMMDLAGNRSFAEDLMDKMVDTHLENLEGFLRAAGNNIDVIVMGDDLGTQNATQVSPDMYHELFYPRHKRIYRYVREKSSAVLLLHSCGSIRPLIPDLIDAGIQALNPVQTSAAGMDSKTLKEEYGDALAFWGGGCDTQTVLPNGTPQEIDAHVRGQISIFAPGGGFIFCPVHNIQAGVPARNVATMLDTFGAYRNYPISDG